MGYLRALSYILQEEPGTSLRAAGFIYTGMSRGGTWDRKGRSRFDKGPIEPKQIYEVEAKKARNVAISSSIPEGGVV
ncbi:hypothetical protein LCGC14_1111730 [marine sediment metagenome]|uniref:Uncharacterized protein n=1 Tax=marine sediment metagenome TaxID=412755 RepID=A0A0F9MUE1_9ZZZZ